MYQKALFAKCSGTSYPLALVNLFMLIINFIKELKQMGKIKMFSDSQTGVCSQHVLKIFQNLSLNIIKREWLYLTQVYLKFCVH